ncbi:MAG TPA: cyanophycinase [Chitinophagaceae bacterium]|nr:cyanophycinase [Chitinophagaceae bacterium]
MARTNKECPTPAGILMLIGGKESKNEEKPEEKEMPSSYTPLEVLKKFVSLIRKDNPVVEVITSASSEGEASFTEYKKIFKDLGITKVNHIHHFQRQEVMANDLVDRIGKADAFYFSGGDQLKLTSLYGGTPFLTALKERYINERIVVAGTSAGAMALSTPMIYAGNEEVQEIGGSIKITTGLEFVKDVCVDTHFNDRGRFVRMAQVIVTNPSSIGIGIGEDTAMIIRKGLEAEIIGTGVIIIIDGFQIADSNVAQFTENKTVTIRDLRVHILSAGDKYIIPQVNPPHR